MKRVLINIICKDMVNESKLAKLLDSCYSENHHVTVNICDYCLTKHVDSLNIITASSDNFKVYVKELNFEDLGSHDSNVFSIAESDHAQFDVILDIDALIELEPNFLDELNLNIFDDVNYGAVYSDFYSKTKSGHKVCILQKSMPLVNNSLPLVAFSAKAYSRHISNENVKGHILSSMISNHVPKSLCCVANA